MEDSCVRSPQKCWWVWSLNLCLKWKTYVLVWLNCVIWGTKELWPVSSSLSTFQPGLTTVCNKQIKKFHFHVFHENTINSDSEEAVKADILTYYNMTKKSVDVLNQMKNAYSVWRIGRCWHLTLFLLILNIVGINTFFLS